LGGLVVYLAGYIEVQFAAHRVKPSSFNRFKAADIYNGGIQLVNRVIGKPFRLRLKPDDGNNTAVGQFAD
jgi:hypothetical protein